ncbi:beta-lactamase family protein [Rhodococcus sp. ARC_M12]|uniref:serine hydrolase domain-containing protein n=1 Tax=Rhodococcus sp. ARC_M12 TaxID=2928854 RepID=UPI001FB20115|nr:serine hydrolase domain-containing protein [Rhodococcus sp. ARC_M12]MCJ0977858.1 beta-lactamase family protein [Rhodococcus sp. ARC_M12]
MRIVHALLIVAAVLTAGSPIPPDPGPASDIGLVADELGLPGVAFRVVSEREVIENVDYGVDGDGAPIDDATPFVWGSVSKSVTAATVYSLAERQVLDIEATVNTVLPDSDSILSGDVTIDDLIHHTSGLPHDVTELDVWGRTERALDVVPTLDVTTADRGTFRYSSLNYLLLQAIVEKVTVERFADVVARETGVHTVGAVAPGHVPFFTFPRSIDTGIDSAGMGYGYLSGSIDELSRYASRQLTAPASNSPETVPTGSGTAYGRGWYVETLSDGTEMRWHSGAVPGYFTHVALVPERHLAVVFATNRYGELEADKLASAARSLVLTRLGIDEPRATGFGLYEIALIASTALAVLLAICAGRILFRIKTPPSRWTPVHILMAAIAGGVLYFGMPMLTGAPNSTLARWAPDVTLLFWILLAELAVIAVALVPRVLRQWTTAHV